MIKKFKENRNICAKMFFLIIKETLMLTVILSLTGHKSLTAIYNCNYLLLPPILYFFHL